MDEPDSKRGKLDEDGLPEGWTVKQSRSHADRWYYFAPLTKQSSWEKPTKPVKAVSGGYHALSHSVAQGSLLSLRLELRRSEHLTS